MEGNHCADACATKGIHAGRAAHVALCGEVRRKGLAYRGVVRAILEMMVAVVEQASKENRDLFEAKKVAHEECANKCALPERACPERAEPLPRCCSIGAFKRWDGQGEWRNRVQSFL
eukprot:6495819-Alexandrium_andersonii.AAC.1